MNALYPITPLVFADLQELNQQACEKIINFAQQALTDHGSFSIALAGGSTPKGVYELLAQQVHYGELDLKNWKFFFGDERLVPQDHPDSNFNMANNSLFQPAGVKANQIFAMPTTSQVPELGAEKYEQTLRTELPLGTAGMPVFDLILLGMGSDGHTASLFPYQPAVEETKKIVVVTDHGVLPPPVKRITLSLPLINAAQNVMFLVTKADKHPALMAVLEQKLFGNPPSTPPAALVRPTGDLLWLVDEAAFQG